MKKIAQGIDWRNIYIYTCVYVCAMEIKYKIRNKETSYLISKNVVCLENAYLSSMANTRVPISIKPFLTLPLRKNQSLFPSLSYSNRLS